MGWLFFHFVLVYFLYRIWSGWMWVCEALPGRSPQFPTHPPVGWLIFWGGSSHQAERIKAWLSTPALASLFSCRLVNITVPLQLSLFR